MIYSFPFHDGVCLRRSVERTVIENGRKSKVPQLIKTPKNTRGEQDDQVFAGLNKRASTTNCVFLTNINIPI